MASKRKLSSSLPCDPPESQINPKRYKTTGILPRLVTPTSKDEDEQIVRLLVEEDAWCVGSCNGWLFLLDDEDATPFIVSAFSSSARFYLPPLETLPFSPQVEKSYFMKALRKSFISKAVVVGNPDTHESFAAVVLYTDSIYCKLAYCKNRDGDLSWEALPGEEGGLLSYNEIMVRGRALNTLTTELAVHTWDLSGAQPIMTRQFHPSIPRAIWEADYKLSFNKFYLAESSSGEVLLVVRRVGYYVDGDGVAVEEYDLLTDEDPHPLVCPYRTLKFDVYKVDFEENEWVQVEDLGDKALFVGCNNSLSLSAGELAGYEENMIYYTDDNWEQMNEDYLYGGHDLGKFNLQLGRVEPIDIAIEDDRIVPPPFWIVPAH